MKTSLAALLCLIAITVCGIALARIFWRPYGHREAYMRIVDKLLHDYARDHGGALPDGPDGYSALAKLYPAYSTTGAELAGLSGDISCVTNSLRLGRSISNCTSFQYVPGLHETDNPRLAVLWEKRGHLLASGAVCLLATRPVLLLSSNFTNVPIARWAEFERQQALLRHALAPSRSRAPGSSGP